MPPAKAPAGGGKEKITELKETEEKKKGKRKTVVNDALSFHLRRREKKKKAGIPRITFSYERKC